MDTCHARDVWLAWARDRTVGPFRVDAGTTSEEEPCGKILETPVQFVLGKRVVQRGPDCIGRIPLQSQLAVGTRAAEFLAPVLQLLV